MVQLFLIKIVIHFLSKSNIYSNNNSSLYLSGNSSKTLLFATNSDCSLKNGTLSTYSGAKIKYYGGYIVIYGKK